MIVAGNFEDQGSAPAYIKEYLGALNFSPTFWGVHPYVSVEGEEEKWFNAVKKALPGEGSGHIWFTEIAARKCGRTFNHEEAGQTTRAAWLVNTLIHNAQPEHVFYYSFMLGEGKTPNCSAETDTALYVPNPGDPEVPDRPRAAASYILGNKGFPMGYTESAVTFPTSGEAELHGAVFPNEEPNAHYKFEYGTSTAYGSSTATGSLAGGFPDTEKSVAARIAGLTTNVTYHYRIVAWNAEGTHYGADGTLILVAPNIRIATVETAKGEVLAFGHNAAGELLEFTQSPSGTWKVSNVSELSSGHLTISGAPTAIVTRSGEVCVFADNASGELTDFVEAGGGWTSGDVSAQSNGDPHISGAPSATTGRAGEPLVFANSPSGELISFAATGVWTANDVSGLSPGDPHITGDPSATSTTHGEVLVFADNASGELTDFVEAGGGWTSGDVSAQSNGDPHIIGTPTVMGRSSGEPLAFASNPSGELLEFAATGAWNVSNLTALTGGTAFVSG
jgi:hypothetical protein